MNPVLETRKLSKCYAGVHANREVSLELRDGELHALIGPNGAGKSTFIACVCGETALSSGQVLFAGEDISALPAPARARRGLSRSFQISALFDELSVEQNLMLAVQAHQGHSFRFWRPVARDQSLRAPAWALLQQFDLQREAQTPAGALAHGEKRQLEVAMALAGEPRALLLDEPMAGIGPGGSAALTELLRALKGRYAMLLVEHDMDAVFALADRISVLVAGELIASGTPDQIRDDAAVRRAYLGDEAC